MANTKINKNNKTKTSSVWYLLFPPLSPQTRVKMRTPQRLGFNPLIGANEQKLSRLENPQAGLLDGNPAPRCARKVGQSERLGCSSSFSVFLSRSCPPSRGGTGETPGPAGLGGAQSVRAAASRGANILQHSRETGVVVGCSCEMAGFIINCGYKVSSNTENKAWAVSCS